MKNRIANLKRVDITSYVRKQTYERSRILRIKCLAKHREIADISHYDINSNNLEEVLNAIIEIRNTERIIEYIPRIIQVHQIFNSKLLFALLILLQELNHKYGI